MARNCWQEQLRIAAPWAAVLRAFSGHDPVAAMLGGAWASGDDWICAPLIAVEPTVALRHHRLDGCTADPLGALERLVTRRRSEGGAAETGVLALLGFDLLTTGAGDGREVLPELLVLEIDRSLRQLEQNCWLWSARSLGGALARPRAEQLQRLAVESARSGGEEGSVALRGVGRPTTSLPREHYVQRVERIQGHIARGDIYQANLSQRFAIPIEGDARVSFARLAPQGAASRTAFVEIGDTKVLSLSPESFLRVDRNGQVETRPIKGTRPRATEEQRDQAMAKELLTSEKERAELMMIVDLERNDLGRVCLPGSVRVPQPVKLRSLATVHHLEARVCGQLREPRGLRELLLATFPGGSISGAPKRRAIQILHEVEPVRRNFFTGVLLWCGDDGTIDSSILIRTIVIDRDTAYIGAGGGVVAESDPVAEWRESCHKARMLTRSLGFEPEEAE